MDQRRTRRSRHRGRRTRRHRQHGGAVPNLKDWLSAVKADRTARAGIDYTLEDLKKPEVALPLISAKTVDGGMKQYLADSAFKTRTYDDIRFTILAISNFSYFKELEKTVGPLKRFTASRTDDAEGKELTALEVSLRELSGDSIGSLDLNDVGQYPLYIWYLYANGNINNPEMSMLRDVPIPSVLEE